MSATVLPGAEAPTPRRWGIWLALFAVLATSIALNLSEQDFPLAYHPDETRKVEFVLEGTQDFKHPLLILQATRGAIRVLGPGDAQAVVAVARTISAVFGTLSVLMLFLLVRRSMGDGLALVGALALAVCPIVVVHAHYFKEDMALTVFSLTSLWTFFEMTRKSSSATAVAFGIALGLAFSSHYKTALLLPVFAVAVALLPADKRKRVTRYALAALMLSGAVFLVVNYPAVVDPGVFLSGLLFEAEHAWEGHHVRVGGMHPLLTFHLWESLLPGMTPALAIWCLAAVGLSVVSWRRCTWEDRVLLIYTGTCYLAVELAPLKPYPGFVRYVLPAVPGLIYFGCRLLEYVWARSSRPVVQLVVASMVLVALMVEAADSVLLVRGLEDDTRAASGRWVAENADAAIFELYSSQRPTDTVSLVNVDVEEARAKGVTHLVSSSFLFERLAIASSLPGQRDYVYDFDEKYDELFKMPFVEFVPKHRSFAFSNPTIRVIDIRDDASGESGRQR